MFRSILCRVKRRQILQALGGGLALAARARRAEADPRRLVWFSTGDRTSAGAFLQAMRDGLRDLGYREGQDLVIETRSVEGLEQQQQLATEILASRPAVIVTQGRAARILKLLSPAVPVVFGF